MFRFIVGMGAVLLVGCMHRPHITCLPIDPITTVCYKTTASNCWKEVTPDGQPIPGKVWTCPIRPSVEYGP